MASTKHLVGHHLMRVRIRKRIFTTLQEIADEETERTGRHTTVSDLVRAACFNYILVHRVTVRLEHAPTEDPIQVDKTAVL